jgi:hypothetical protein
LAAPGVPQTDPLSIPNAIDAGQDAKPLAVIDIAQGQFDHRQPIQLAPLFWIARVFEEAAP